MKTHILIVLALVVAGCAQTDRFALVDRGTGQEYGPFGFREGATVGLGVQTYELKKLPSRDNVLETKLRDRIIPQVEFREADVRDVIQFFRESGRYRGVDQTWVDPPTEIVLLLTPAQAERVPKITLSAQTISMYDTIRIVADLTGLQFVIENGKVLLRMKK